MSSLSLLRRQLPRHLELPDRVELAVGVARPGSFAKVYGADNRTLGFHDMRTAVIMADAGLEGVASYTVPPDADIGPCIDIDLPRGLDLAVQSTLKANVARGGVRSALDGDELRTALQGFGPSIEIQVWMLDTLRGLYRHITGGQGARAATLPSGRGAHLLVVGLGPAGRQELLTRLAALQDELGLKLAAAGLPAAEAAFEVKSYCRPPASPHRLEGDLGILLYPLPGLDEGPQRDLLADLAERGRHRIEQGLLAPAVPPWLNEMMREGRLWGRRRDRFLRAAVRDGLPFEHAAQAVEPQGYRTRPGPGWLPSLETAWPAALEAVHAIDEALAPIRAAAPGFNWAYRAGATDRRILLAYIEIAEAEATTSSLIIAPGDRRVAAVAVCSASAVKRANRRLRDHGWLKLRRSGRWRTREATTWQLRLPRVLAEEPVLRSSTSPLPLLGGRYASLVSLMPEHEVWIGLPPAAAVVWSLLTETPGAARSIVTGRSLRHIQRILVALEQVNLAVRQGTTAGSSRGRRSIAWVKGPASLDEAAAWLGVTGARRDRRHALKKQHSKERRDLEEALIGPQPRMTLPLPRGQKTGTRRPSTPRSGRSFRASGKEN
jgi:hypothetical protein